MERHLAMVSLPYRQPTVVDDQYIPPSKTTCYLFEKIFLSFRHLFSTFSKVRLFFFSITIAKDLGVFAILL